MTDSSDLPVSPAAQAELDRDTAEYLPKPGDKLLSEEPPCLLADPFSSFPPSRPRDRSGRWDLYAVGYLEAGDLVIAECLAGRNGPAPGRPGYDFLLYPILHAYRHHLELLLKEVTRSAATLAATDGSDEQNHGHKLLRLWEQVGRVYPEAHEWASPECTEACESLIKELDRVDPNGQAGRYPWGNNGDPTLVKLHAVNLPNLRSGVHKISHYLTCILEAISEKQNRWAGSY